MTVQTVGESSAQGAEQAQQRKKKPGGGGHLFVPPSWHRPVVLKTLRRVHAWLGMWGAVMGLLFGASGLFLNHRATMKIPGVDYVKTQWQIQLPQPLPLKIGELSLYLQQNLNMQRKPTQQKVSPAGPTPWPGATQPEHWEVAFNDAHGSVHADYWVGNETVSVQRQDANFLATLTRLHKGTGASAAWILLTDTLAGALIVLSITGLLLWTKLHGPRLLALGLAGTCFALLLCLGL